MSNYVSEIEHVLWGETPPLFLFEIVGRTVILLLFARILVRWLGKRGIGQLSLYEFVVQIAMGSALGDPMFYPSVPLLPPTVELVIIVGVQRLLAWMSAATDPQVGGSTRCVHESRRCRRSRAVARRPE